MLKPISAMTDHEMLVELMQAKRRGDTVRNIKLVCAGIVIAVLVYLGFRYLPPVIHYFQKIGDALETIQNGVTRIQNVTDSVKGTVDGLLEKISSVFRW